MQMQITIELDDACVPMLAAAVASQILEDVKPELIAIEAINKWISNTCRNAEMQSALSEHEKGRQAIMAKFMPSIDTRPELAGIPALVNRV
jgi:hypothetical protein